MVKKASLDILFGLSFNKLFRFCSTKDFVDFIMVYTSLSILHHLEVTIFIYKPFCSHSFNKGQFSQIGLVLQCFLANSTNKA